MTPGVCEWDEKFPYVLFTYRATLQFTTGETPFHLLNGRDPQLPTVKVLSLTLAREQVMLDDYKTHMMREMSSVSG